MLPTRALVPLLILLPTQLCHAGGSTLVKVLRDHRAKVTSLVWSMDGKTLASGDEKGLIILTEIRSGKVSLRLSYRGEATPLDFSPDGKLLAVEHDKQVRLLDTKAGVLMRSFKTSSDEARFSADGKQLTTGTLLGAQKERTFEVAVWDVVSGKKLTFHRWPQEEDSFNDFAAAVSANGQQVATNTAGKLKIYSTSQVKQLAVVPSDPKADDWPIILNTSWSEDGKWVASSGGYYEGPGHFDVWDIQSHRRAWGDTFHDWSPCVAFSPHNRLLAVGTTYQTEYDETRRPGNVVLLYDLSTHKLRSTLQGHKGDVNALAWSPDGKQLASASNDKTVRIWTLAR